MNFARILLKFWLVVLIGVEPILPFISTRETAFRSLLPLANASGQSEDGLDKLKVGPDRIVLTNQHVNILDPKGSVVKRVDLNSITSILPNLPEGDTKILYSSSPGSFSIQLWSPKHNPTDTSIPLAEHVLAENLGVRVLSEDRDLILFVDSEFRINAINAHLVKDYGFREAWPIPIFRDLYPGLTEALKQNFNSASERSDLNASWLTTKNIHSDLKFEFELLDAKNLDPIRKAGDWILSLNGKFYLVSRDRVVDSVGNQTEAVLVPKARLASIDEGEIQDTFSKVTSASKDSTSIEGTSENSKDTSEASSDKNSETYQKTKQIAFEAEIHALLGRQAPLDFISALSSGSRNLKFANGANRDIILNQEAKELRDSFAKSYTHDSPITLGSENILELQSKEIGRKTKSGWSIGTALKSLAAITAGGAYLSFPGIYEISTTLQHIHWIEWTYQNLFPAVLLDAQYRSTLFESLGNQMLIWPLVLGASAVAGKIFQIVEYRLKGSYSQQAIFIRNYAHTWADLTAFNRIVTLGFRFSAWLGMTYWNLIIEYGLRQKVFFSAVSLGLNPFQKIAKDSEFGKELGLTETRRVGINSPIAKSGPIEEGKKIQAAVALKKHRAEMVAFLMATAKICESQNISPADLLMVMGDKSDSSEEINLRIQKALSSKESRRNWTILSHELLSEIVSNDSSEVRLDETQNLTDLMLTYKHSADEIAKKLERTPELKKELKWRWLTFKDQVDQGFRSLITLGRDEHQFLKKIYPTASITSEVKKFFTINFLLATFEAGIFGKRADFSHPELLAASENGVLKTSNQHWYDIIDQLITDLGLRGGRRAILDKKEAKPAPIEAYAPWTDSALPSAPRYNNLTGSLKDYLLDLGNPLKSDLGSLPFKRFKRQFSTMFLTLNLALIVRYFILSQTLPVTLHVVLFSLMTSFWFMNWVFDVVPKGNELQHKRVEENISLLKELRRRLSLGGKETQLARAETLNLYKAHNPNALREFLKIPIDQISNQWEQVSTQDILRFTSEHPPLFTAVNPILEWTTTLSGAALGLFLSISYYVITFDPSLMLNASYLTEWAFRSAGLMIGSYFLLGRKPWEFYMSHWNRLREKQSGRGLRCNIIFD